MKLLDVLTAPWAIQPDKLLEIQGIYATHLRGEKIDIAGVEARIGRPLVSQREESYPVIDGVAVIAVDGVIAKRMNLFMEISGGSSSQLIERDIRAALEDTAVHSIVLAIDSPGGTVDGTQALGDAVFAARAVKPVVALASGMMASAAYWIGSAAQQIYIADRTTAVGSIGVVSTHVDVSGAEAQKGVRTTEVFAGKFKRIESQYGPLSESGRATMQERMDHLYGLFVETVANNRGVAVERVLADMADGRIFIGQQAIDAGLVDGVSTLDALVQQLNRDNATRAAPGARLGAPRAGAARITANPTTRSISMPMSREQLAADHPDLVEALLSEGAAAGAAAERARIQAVEGASLPGHESLIASLKFDGTTTGPGAAAAVVAAERQARAAQAAALANDAPQVLPNGAPPAVDASAAAAAAGGAGAKSRADIDRDAKALMKKTPGLTYVQAIKQINPEA
ncbi:signal peptide peptidase SppA [Xylophilus ampelinus]|uniref:Signal peptide peptidase SppA n=1 Tax=Xylophilus ampelinus TaxID=54067 RepID=A0A318SKK1_9BURK|nr:signal peptide peptidase SppA [Xylophilus ampelinus]MCS4508896.1 signal peptide peptidase SppA [Xylophilus ampelinus]PYE79465.1 signal peptide peptidase SppA [Xylophilus ampelinus]